MKDARKNIGFQSPMERLQLLLFKIVDKPFYLVFFLIFVTFWGGQDVFAGTPDFSYFIGSPIVRGMFQAVRNWLNYIVIILIGVGLVVFLWGVIKYITSGPEETKRAEARQLIVYGIIGLFAMVGVWGLVSLIGYIFGIGLGGTTSLPRISTPEAP